MLICEDTHQRKTFTQVCWNIISWNQEKKNMHCLIVVHICDKYQESRFLYLPLKILLIRDMSEYVKLYECRSSSNWKFRF